MFTGIIQDVGHVRSIQPGDRTSTVVVESEIVGAMNVGASVAVNGTCLTAVAVEDKSVTVEIGAETLDRTTLGDLKLGQPLNLELPMSAASLFDGHIVQGHIDGVGAVSAVETEGDSLRISVEASPDILRYVVEKGSISVDGISLTVAGVSETTFDVAIIPHTITVTAIGSLVPGDRVNLEVDILAKYVERLLKT